MVRDAAIDRAQAAVGDVTKKLTGGGHCGCEMKGHG
eukprot:COSAG01_NODE_74442_length_213_cov_26.280702_1_plen_35_part_01